MVPRCQLWGDDTGRRRGRGPEVSLSRLPAASLPRVPAHLSPVALSPWWRRACAVPISGCCVTAPAADTYLVVVDRRFMRRTKVAAIRRWLSTFGCVARYYFPATFGARRWRSSPSVGRLMVFQDFLSFLVFLETSEVAGPGPCLLYTSPSPRDQRGSRMPSSA